MATVEPYASFVPKADVAAAVFYGSDVSRMQQAFRRKELVMVRPQAVKTAAAIYPKCLPEYGLPYYLQDHSLTLSDLSLAHEAKDWQRYVALHHDDYKVYALDEAARGGLKGKAYWCLLRDTWHMLRHVYGHKSDWLKLFERSTSPGPRSAMTARERKTFDALPDPLTLYRGACSDHAKGVSWTTDLEVAKSFAERHGGNVYVVKVAKERAIMYLAGRDESEIIVHLHSSHKPKLVQP